MDYSVDGILKMLQDQQRQNFGLVDIEVKSFMFDNIKSVTCCVFDEQDEPHSSFFFDFEADNIHKEKYIEVKKLIDETAKRNSRRENNPLYRKGLQKNVP